MTPDLTMNTSARVLICTLCLALFGSAVAASAADLVELTTTAGRTRRGELDSRTDHKSLWLRRTSRSIAVSFAVPWEQVERATYRDKVYSSEEFRRIARFQKPTLKVSYFDLELGGAATRANGEGLPAPAAASRPRRSSRPRVTSVEIEAEVANWNESVNNDGVQIRIRPVTSSGEVVPLDGVVDIRLIANDYSRRGQDAFVEIGRWSQRLRVKDFDDWGAMYRLPFRAAHPDFNLRLGAQALATARLSVPQHGVFQAATYLQLRSYNPIRDQLQLKRGQRYFPNENARRR